MKNLDSDLIEDSIGEETGGEGVLKGLRFPQAFKNPSITSPPWAVR